LSRSLRHEGLGKTGGLKNRFIIFLKRPYLLSHSAFIIGLLSCVWFAIRTGTKPSRAVYPCQQAAVANSYAWLAAFIFPIFSKARMRIRKPYIRRNLIFIAVAAFAIIATGVLSVCKMNGNYPSSISAGQPVMLSLSQSLAEVTPASDIFVLQGTSGNDSGVAELIDLMGNHNFLFYNSPAAGKNKGPTGLIARDDTIIIKVNSQWDERGGTNTDLLKALIAAILQHPDEFAGEIIVADNGQAQQGPTGQGGSLNYSRNNAEDISQSVQKVVDSFAGSHKVSTYLWDTITRQRVKEYSEGDIADGYIVDEAINPRTDLRTSYPKFKTKYGTYVSFKLGLWNPQQQTYDSDRLKIINVPVLKSHDDFGVSACVKHYMGVLSYKLTEQLGTNAHEAIVTGGLGTEMVETRFPALNIIDAIWVNAFPGAGPTSSYDAATRTNVIAASQDPIALDYWAAKHILLQAAQNTTYGRTHSSSMDPDNMSAPGSFGQWLRLSMQEINQAGYHTTVDEAHMNVYVSQLQLSSSPVPTPGLTQPSTPATQSGPPTTNRGINWTYLAIILAVILVALIVGIILIRKKRQGSNS
jgi:hypothetical protein